MLETDMLICEYNKIPMGRSAHQGMFAASGPLLAIELMDQLKKRMEEDFHPRILICDGYRLPVNKVMFIGHTPKMGSIEDIGWMYDKIIQEAIERKITSLTLPVLGVEDRVRQKGSIKKLVALFKKKIGELLRQTQIKIIISFEEMEVQPRIIEELLDEWEITDVHTEELKNLKEFQPKKLKKKKINMTGEKLVKFAVKLNGKPGIALLDPGSEISMVNRNFVKLLEEGRDYQYLEDLQLLGPGNTELPNQGRIRINKNAGIQLTEDVERVGFEACIVPDAKGDKSWDMLIGNDLPTHLGRTTIQFEEDKKPLVMIEPTQKTQGRLKGKDGKEVKEIILDTLPMFYKGIYTNNLTVLGPFEEKEIKTSMNYAGQVLNLVAPVVKCKHLSKNFHIREGRIERDFRNGTKIKVHNETDEPIVLGKGSLIAYAVKAEEAIITANEEECGRKYCNQAESHTPKDLLKPDQGFINNLRSRIAETIQEEADRDIEHWTGEFKATLHQLKDEGILTKTDKDKIWDESRHYSTGYMVNMVMEGKSALKRKKESYLSGNQDKPPPKDQPGTTLSTVAYRNGDLVKSPNSIAFFWNRRYETDEELHQQMERRFDLIDAFQKSGTHIGEAAVVERDGRYIYGLITKIESKDKTETNHVRESLLSMRDDACKKKINKIEISNLELKEGGTLAAMLEEIFGKTNIECVITTHKAAGKIIGEKEKMTRELGKDPISLEPIENWKNGKITQEFTCPRGTVTEAKYVFDKTKTVEVNASRTRKGLCKEMVLKALRQEPVLESDIRGVEESPDELFEDYIEPENYENFTKFFIETTRIDKTPFKFPEGKQEAEQYTDLEHIINNFKRLVLGKYYHEDAKARAKLKLIIFKYRDLFATHKWNVGRIRRDFYVHKAVFKNNIS